MNELDIILEDVEWCNISSETAKQAILYWIKDTILPKLPTEANESSSDYVQGQKDILIYILNKLKEIQ